MKLYACLYALGLFAPSGCLAQGTFTPEYVSAINNGALAKVTFRVSDDEGHAVSNASVRVGFVMLNRKSIQLEGKTDTNGLFVAEAEAQWELGARISKEGYYDTVWETLLAKGNESVSDGRWLPWNPTIPVVLKSRRNPVSMVHFRKDMPIRSFDIPLGFDFEMGDWVNPHGKGAITDMIVKFEGAGEDLPYRKLVVEFPGERNGAYLRRMDVFSVLKSQYHASLGERYEGRIDNAQGQRCPVHVLLGDEDYLVFRVRSKVDENGDLISAHYGKIYGPLDYFVSERDKLRLIYYYSPPGQIRLGTA